MKTVVFHKSILIFVCVTMLLFCCVGCSQTNFSSDDSSSSSSISESSVSSEDSMSDSMQNIVPDFSPFTVLYASNVTLNPLKCNNNCNLLIDSLIYEPLFTIDSSFNPVPILISDYSTDDGKTYSFTVKDGIFFHDGSEMTAEDVVYSIRQASYSEKFSSRLDDFYSTDATGRYSLTLTLEKVNYKFLSLLDIPIIKNLSAGENVPAGTGPYTFVTENQKLYLSAFGQYRDYNKIPADRILLKEYDSSNIVSEFTAGKISLILSDPTSSDSFQIRADHEARYYSTSVLQYIGFNQRSGDSLLLNSDFRKAVSFAVNRDKIISETFHGYAVSAPFALHPSLGFYDKTWETDTEYSLYKLSSIFDSLGFEDTDGNGWLEYKYGSDYEEITLKFIINSDNSYKTEAAKQISNTLRSIGLNVTLTILSWSEYSDALNSGNFDLYYAETRLTSDFDLSEILTSEGSVNYCGINDPKYLELIDAYLAAENTDKTVDKAKALAEYVQQDSAIIPILFKKSSVLSQRNMIDGILPTQSNTVNGLIGGKIN